MMHYSNAALFLLLSACVSAGSLRRRDIVQQSSVESLHDDSPDADVRIVGGEDSSPGEFPWFAASSGNVLCGASLIHKQLLLTAAHCAAAFTPGSTVHIGSYMRGSNVSGGGGAETRTVSVALPHPEFSINNLQNDYMLLKLDSPVESITPIELNTDDAVPADGQTVTSMGFGYTSEDGQVSLTLRDVDLTVTNHLSCTMSYLFINQITENNMMCAGAADVGQDTCSGDSGGPLITADGKQVGIVSYGLGCARPNIPGVYSRVSGGMDFINSGICSLATEDRPDDCPATSDPTDDILLY